MTDIPETLKLANHTNARHILSAALDHYGDRIAIAMSFQVGGCVLLDMIHRMERNVQIVSLDTGRLPEETYDCARRITERYGFPIRWVFPKHESVEPLIRENGVYSFRDSVTNRKTCCGIRKVEPLTRALDPFDAWITGRRMDQSEQRRDLNVAEPDMIHPGKIKINPLALWKVNDLWHYVRKHNVPYNRLYDEGYLSIGCECCTRPCKGGEDERAGRWWWESKDHKECGIHLIFKDGAGI
jgi:phosphoadenosine phosphosulfate reductase